MITITLAKALKCKNRLVERIRKVDGDIQQCNSRPAGAEKPVDVRALYGLRRDLFNKLVELKCKIMFANGPIWQQIFTLSETKATITFLQGVTTTHGKNFATFGRYAPSATEVFDYEADLKKTEVDQIIRELETKIDVLQDEIDQHNYATKIDFEMPL